MTRAYNVVDADGHILEPLDLWDRYIDPKFRDRAPRIIKRGRYRQAAARDGRARCSEARSAASGAIGGVGARQGIVSGRHDGIPAGQAGRVRPA